jgi:hypothetical protein
MTFIGFQFCACEINPKFRINSIIGQLISGFCKHLYQYPQHYGRSGLGQMGASGSKFCSVGSAHSWSGIIHLLHNGYVFLHTIRSDPIQQNPKGPKHFTFQSGCHLPRNYKWGQSVTFVTYFSENAFFQILTDNCLLFRLFPNVLQSFKANHETAL